MAYARPRLEPLEPKEAPYNLFGTMLVPVDGSFLYEWVDEPTRADAEAVEAGMQMWADAANVSFREVGRGAGQIRLYLRQPTAPFLAVASYPPAAMIRFGAPPTPPVAGHEIGHTLGIDHSADPDALMNGTLLRATGLNADDVAAVRALYGAGRGTVESNRLTQALPAPPPADPYPGSAAAPHVASADHNQDGLADSVFLADAGGHLKVFSGADGRELVSALAFPGFNGGCRLAAEDGRIVAAAVLENKFHLKGYVGGIEVASVIAPS